MLASGKKKKKRGNPVEVGLLKKLTPDFCMQFQSMTFSALP